MRGGLLVPWAAERYRFEQEFHERLAAYPAEFSNVPPEWEEWAVSQYVAAKLFCGRRLVREFLKSPRRTERLSDDEIEKLRRFSREGWRFTACEVDEAFGGDFFNVLDHPTGEKLLLYSPSVSRLLRARAKTFILQLFDNGACFQAYGAVHSYLAFDYRDLVSYARAAAPHAPGIVSLLENDVTPFIPLMSYARVPRSAHDGVPLRCVYKCVRVPEFTPGYLAVEEKNGVVKLDFGEWGEWPHFAHGYYDRAGASARFVNQRE
ncbi:MAG: hypothetical protein JXD23_05835 [Spirochaetales bacterium]|nr:hypothetical protein [Spirochaetales bacterium]